MKTGDVVRVRGLDGPKMLIGAVSPSRRAGATYDRKHQEDYHCGWFTANGEWTERVFNEAVFEKVS